MRKALLAPDTSVIIAAFASWHASHGAALAVLARTPSLIAHCALETYSVLTRLPAPHRVSGAIAATFLRLTFPTAPLTLSGSAHQALLSSLERAGVAGGATYDALVAATAVQHGATLFTLDSRAERTYARIGVRFVRV